MRVHARQSLEPDHQLWPGWYNFARERNQLSGVGMVACWLLVAIAANRPIAPGEIIHADMLYALRPATGISPEFVDSVIGKQALTRIEAGAPVQWESIQ